MSRIRCSASALARLSDKRRAWLSTRINGYNSTFLTAFAVSWSERVFIRSLEWQQHGPAAGWSARSATPTPTATPGQSQLAGAARHQDGAPARPRRNVGMATGPTPPNPRRSSCATDLWHAIRSRPRRNPSPWLPPPPTAAASVRPSPAATPGRRAESVRSSVRPASTTERAGPGTIKES